MSQNNSTKNRIKIVAGLMGVLALVVCGLIFTQLRKNEARSGAVLVDRSVSLDDTANALNADPSTSGGERIDRDVMLRQLKIWIKKREGHEVVIVSSQNVQDFNGNAVSLNVTVSSRLNGVVTAQKVTEELAEVNKREKSIRSQLTDAYQAKDISGVNRLVAELRKGREKFVQDLEVSTYKLSLVRELPPVLAFWPGLPYETIKEEAARDIAISKLGTDITSRGLVRYSSVTALLHFVNERDESIYIDPFNMVEVPLAGMKSTDLKDADNGDIERKSRIEKQWLEYL